MMERMRSLLQAAVLCVAIAILFTCAGSAEGSQPRSTYIENGALTIPVLKISKHGNVKLDITFGELEAADIEAADIITVYVNGSAYEMPVGTSLSDVDSGEMLCWLDTEGSEVELCVNSGSFAEKTGMAVKEKIEEDPGYSWDVLTGSVSVALSEKQGYADEYSIRKLERSNERGDHPGLTDEEFANFRAVTASALKADTLYRSSSPLDPSLARNEYAMVAMQKAGIRSVLNLADTAQAMEAYESYMGSYYSTCTILNETTGYDFASAGFALSVKDCVLFINANDGPYLIHCKEGKDRTGMLCAILSCYAGATYNEVLNDYMLTYENYYGVTEGSETYNKIVETCLKKDLEQIFGINNVETAELQSAAARYLSAAGLTESDLETLKNKIAA